MKAVIEIGIPYNDNGDQCIKKVKIGFVSNEMIRRYNLAVVALSDAVALQDELNKQTNQLGGVVVNKQLTFKEKKRAAEPIKNRIQELKKEIKENNHRDLMAERFELIKLVLEKNGCTDKDLLNLKWWDENTEPHVSWVFLQMAVIKDMSGAKKKASMNLTRDSLSGV